MSDVVIKVENLSKQYRLGVINHGTLAKDLQAWWAQKRGKEDPNSQISLSTSSQTLAPDLTLNPSPKGEGLKKLPVPLGKGQGERSKEDGGGFYALRDINFEVRQGEVLGIIGSNGAGKSTLLKILSRVTSPTSGSVKIKGRIGSLLEVGTGFHPELTGRENIYLNGAILGMKRWEIDKKLDEIIDFSGVEKFIDTPVKRYSSGMYVRLAFAVAAHLDPEILVIDEVLAVGDAEFQKKCLGKMDDVSKKEGRTVLFVSHNMGAVGQLCDMCMIIEKGNLVSMSRDVSSIINKYLIKNENATSFNKEDLLKYSNEYYDIIDFCIDGSNNVFSKKNEDPELIIRVNIKQSISGMAFGYAVYSEDNVRLFSSLCTDNMFNTLEVTDKPRKIHSKLPLHLLNEGTYRISLIAGIHNQKWFIHPESDSPNLCIKISPPVSDSIFWTKKRPGVIAPNIAWSVSDE